MDFDKCVYKKINQYVFKNQRTKMNMKTEYAFNSRLDTKEENDWAGRSQVNIQTKAQEIKGRKMQNRQYMCNMVKSSTTYLIIGGEVRRNYQEAIIEEVMSENCQKLDMI